MADLSFLFFASCACCACCANDLIGAASVIFVSEVTLTTSLPSLYLKVAPSSFQVRDSRQLASSVIMSIDITITYVSNATNFAL